MMMKNSLLRTALMACVSFTTSCVEPAEAVGCCWSCHGSEQDTPTKCTTHAAIKSKPAKGKKCIDSAPAAASAKKQASLTPHTTAEGATTSQVRAVAGNATTNKSALRGKRTATQKSLGLDYTSSSIADTASTTATADDAVRQASESASTLDADRGEDAVRQASESASTLDADRGEPDGGEVDRAVESALASRPVEAASTHAVTKEGADVVAAAAAVSAQPERNVAAVDTSVATRDIIALPMSTTSLFEFMRRFFVFADGRGGWSCVRNFVNEDAVYIVGSVSNDLIVRVHAIHEGFQRTIDEAWGKNVELREFRPSDPQREMLLRVIDILSRQYPDDTDAEHPMSFSILVKSLRLYRKHFPSNLRNFIQDSAAVRYDEDMRAVGLDRRFALTGSSFPATLSHMMYDVREVRSGEYELCRQETEALWQKVGLFFAEFNYGLQSLLQRPTRPTAPRGIVADWVRSLARQVVKLDMTNWDEIRRAVIPDADNAPRCGYIIDLLSGAYPSLATANGDVERSLSNVQWVLIASREAGPDRPIDLEDMYPPAREGIENRLREISADLPGRSRPVLPITYWNGHVPLSVRSGIDTIINKIQSRLPSSLDRTDREAIENYNRMTRECNDVLDQIRAFFLEFNIYF